MAIVIGVKSTGGEIVGVSERIYAGAATGRGRRMRMVKVEVGIERRHPKFISSAMLENMVWLVCIGHGEGWLRDAGGGRETGE